MTAEAVFLTTLACERLRGEEKFTITKPLVFRSAEAGTTFVVPIGFKTNFVTGREVPGVAWLAGTLSEEASAVHDLLYETHEVTQEVADKVFLEALGVIRRSVRATEKADGISAWRRGLSNALDFFKHRTMYLGLRIGGASNYAGDAPPPDQDEDLYRG